MSFVFLAPLSLQARTIVHNNVSEEKEKLVLSVLKTALKQVEPDIQFQAYSEQLPDTRAEEAMKAGTLSVIWASSTPEREEALWGVRIPAIKGLLGYRIFIIRPESQAKFDQVETLDDLLRLTAGQGRYWGDTKILKDAGIDVVTANKYESLIHMVDGQRFDYYPRAIHEPFVELSNNPELNLTIEKNLLLVYPLTMNFYVTKDNTEMHELVRRGLELATENGELDKMFYSHPMVKSALEASRYKERRIIRIGNTDLHPDTPVDREELWLELMADKDEDDVSATPQYSIVQ